MNALNVKRSIIAIDLKSFFAACECIDRNLDMNKTPLIVCSSNKGAITLAITPYLRNKGIKGRTRVYNLPKDINYIKVPPRMALYKRKSKEVIEIYKEFIAPEDIHIYSIDEVFLDVSNYLKLYKKNSLELAKIIIDTINKKTGLTAAAGIGPNIFLAKVAMDLDAKNNKDNIAVWTFKDVENKLWEIKPLSKIWGIGNKMEKNLNRLGIYTGEDLAKFNKNILIDKFGVIGLKLWNNLNGIDETTINKLNEKPKSRSISQSQMLYKDYDETNITLIIRETVEMLTRRLLKEKKRATSVTLTINYSKSVGGGFSGREKFSKLTNDSKSIFLTCINIFEKHYEYLPIRQVSVSLGDLVDDIGEQLSLFEPYEKVKKRNNQEEAIDYIKEKYGPNSLLKASSLLDDSTIKERNKKNLI